MKQAPKQINNYEAKLRHIIWKQEACCAIAAETGITAPITELHHAGVHNTKINRKRFPLLIHSLWNLRGVNHNIHLCNGSWGKISLIEADKREAFLQRHPMIAKKLHLEG